jgi:D-tagatose-1,6-bisphosphate aldolase subunit GatZ/KbaZ
MKSILDVIREHKSGSNGGLYAVCSAHPLAIEAGLRLAHRGEGLALIEATSNQVNQDGGYTGMRPRDFRARVYAIAAAVGLAPERIVLGGDHLGPNCWQRLPAAAALQKSAILVDEYVSAGFRKIHLDCTMSCADDSKALDDESIAERSAALCRSSEAAWMRSGGEAPVYIVGSEVPVPGGAHEALGALELTTPAAARATLDAHRGAFARHGLEAAWERVVGLVVQPGVEFDHEHIIDYVPSKAVALSRSIEAVPGVVFEAHSTDYQRPAALAALVRDHFAILKVGPALTFALREVLWALSDMATELKLMPEGSLKETLLAQMRQDPRFWSAYYVDPKRQAFDLQFSLSDRIRYYWAAPAVERSCTQLLERLALRPIPKALVSQYLPVQYAAIRAGLLKNEPRELVLHGIEQVLAHYELACRGHTIADRPLSKGGNE